jgi:hypothetical protein
MPLWVRRCLTVACLVAAWLVARPASAAAPLCDERGASVTAPVPVLDTPNASVDVGERTDGCDGDPARDTAYHRGERPHRVCPSCHADVILPAPAGLVVPAAIEVFPRPNVATVGSAGVTFPLERPPR